MSSTIDCASGTFEMVTERLGRVFYKTVGTGEMRSGAKNEVGYPRRWVDDCPDSMGASKTMIVSMYVNTACSSHTWSGA